MGNSTDKLTTARDWLKREIAFLSPNEREELVCQLNQQVGANPSGDPFAIVENIISERVYAHLAD